MAKEVFSLPFFLQSKAGRIFIIFYLHSKPHELGSSVLWIELSVLHYYSVANGD